MSASVRQSSVVSAPVEGPWVQAFEVLLPLPLRSKSNDRRFRHGGRAATPRTFEQQVAWYLRASLPAGWEVGDRSSPLSSRPKVVAAVAARSNLDAANFSKSVFDAAEGVVVVNDASIAACAAVATRGSSDSFALAFARLPGDAGADELSEALVVLLRAPLLSAVHGQRASCPPAGTVGGEGVVHGG